MLVSVCLIQNSEWKTVGIAQKHCKVREKSTAYCSERLWLRHTIDLLMAEGKVGERITLGFRALRNVCI